MKLNKLFLFSLTALVLTACDNTPEDPTDPTPPPSGSQIICDGYSGAYILNEGGWGMNEARIDQLDFSSGTLLENQYVNANPSVVLALGDVANDLKLHNQRLYAVVNGSHKVEVMEASNLKRVGQIDISSPRSIAFTDTHAYVTSYVDGNNDNGSIVEFSLETLKVTRSVSVGQEPEGITIIDNTIFVANSGGLHAPNYSDEVWCLNVSDLSITNKIKVAPNLRFMSAAPDGSVWVTSQGNYYDVPSGLFRIKNGVVTSANVPCTGFTFADNKILYYASSWSYETNSNTINYGTIDNETMDCGPSFITDGSESNITTPYGVFAAGGLIIVTDAKSYTTSGAIHIYDASGKLIKQYSTGVLPNSIVFLPKNQ
ncbi:MAG: hypothetical protein E7082_00840 [Bacteroidales bacterium]|nr:hypothetical protein [Bacteroidales bacterium]